MREQFEASLRELEKDFYNMSDLVLANLKVALRGIGKHSDEDVVALSGHDVKINQFELEIETSCILLLALQNPLVSDLRLVVAILKACSDLERIGDHALAIVKLSAKLSSREGHLELDEEINRMAQLVEPMFEKVMASFKERDLKRAEQLAQRDNKVDDYFLNISKCSLSEMKNQETSVKAGVEYITIAGHIERIGDYLTNICERIVYLETGELVELN